MKLGIHFFDPSCPCEKCGKTRQYLHDKHLSSGHAELLKNTKAKLPELEKLLADATGHWAEEDKVYRYYHHSFKVFHLQTHTKAIVGALKELLPGVELNPMFVRIYEAGTSKGFTKDTNANWEAETRPILEAFFHAKYFLEQAIRYGKVIEGPEYMLPSGWAALLYLYNRRWRPSRYRLGMSELHAPVVRIGKVGKHPNADTLSITQAGGFPVIFRTGDFKEGDLAVYVPIDSLLPSTIRRSGSWRRPSPPRARITA
jgi:hypothetical protein